MKIRREKANDMLGMVSKPAIEGKKQKDQEIYILKLRTHVKMESTPVRKKCSESGELLVREIHPMNPSVHRKL